MAGGRNPGAWNNWYHLVGSTHAAWLPGDPRGFRTFNHRLHVEGDYQSPPPLGRYAALRRRAGAKRRKPPVVLGGEQRRVICRALIEKLEALEAEPLALAVAGQHFHGLIRFADLDAATEKQYRQSLLRNGRDPAPRHFLGLARRHAALVLGQPGLKSPGPLWAAGPKIEPIRDRSHQVNVVRYIRDHAREDAAVYVLARFLWETPGEGVTR